MNPRVRYTVAAVAAAVEALALVTATSRTAGATLPSATSFPFTGANQTFTVPAGVCGVRIEVEGAAGGNDYYGTPGGHGGSGVGEFTVTPGDVLTVTVGGIGSHRVSMYDQTVITGGFGGGGQADYIQAGGGGGATTVISGADPLIVAGGGGGTAYSHSLIAPPGNGGDAGQPGTDAGDGNFGAIGGGGGSLSGGGAGGVGTYATGVSGSRGVGGAGLQWAMYAAGAGGGGYFGGGSGGAGANGSYPSPSGGGGGSGFLASGATNVGTWAGHGGLGDGAAAIAPITNCPDPTTSISFPSTTVAIDPNALMPAFTG